MYSIRGLCHRTDISMGRHGFNICLSPDFREAVQRSGMTEDHARQHVDRSGREWLDAAGFDSIFDPDNCGAWADPKIPPGPNARPMYSPREIRLSWGEWGPEHISVPGNACGLDIERSPLGCIFRGGVSLVPHNIDSLNQKYLLLIVFTELAYSVQLFSDERATPLKPLETASK